MSWTRELGCECMHGWIQNGLPFSELSFGWVSYEFGCLVATLGEFSDERVG